MADILHDFVINMPANKVFDGISTPEGLNTWWTKTSSGTPAVGKEFNLGFGSGYDWKAVVTKSIPDKEFELQMTHSDDDWNKSKVRFILDGKGTTTQVKFSHTGWPAENEHYRISSYCWAMYLRILKRNLEFGESVPYEDRLDV